MFTRLNYNCSLIAKTYSSLICNVVIVSYFFNIEVKNPVAKISTALLYSEFFRPKSYVICTDNISSAKISSVKNFAILRLLGLLHQYIVDRRWPPTELEGHVNVSKGTTRRQVAILKKQI